jgi:hypothetical protein
MLEVQRGKEKMNGHTTLTIDISDDLYDRWSNYISKKYKVKRGGVTGRIMGGKEFNGKEVIDMMENKLALIEARELVENV